MNGDAYGKIDGETRPFDLPAIEFNSAVATFIYPLRQEDGEMFVAKRTCVAHRKGRADRCHTFLEDGATIPSVRCQIRSYVATVYRLEFTRYNNERMALKHSLPAQPRCNEPVECKVGLSRRARCSFFLPKQSSRVLRVLVMESLQTEPMECFWGTCLVPDELNATVGFSSGRPR